MMLPRKRMAEHAGVFSVILRFSEFGGIRESTLRYPAFAENAPQEPFPGARSASRMDITMPMNQKGPWAFLAAYGSRTRLTSLGSSCTTDVLMPRVKSIVKLFPSYFKGNRPAFTGRIGARRRCRRWLRRHSRHRPRAR